MNPIPEKVVFYHSSQWKIVFRYDGLGHTLLFEFILSTQFFVEIFGIFRAYIQHTTVYSFT